MPSSPLQRRLFVFVSFLFVGFVCLFFCCVVLSVATPLLVEELVGKGLSQRDALWWIGTFTSIGTFGYALGKLFLGGLGDYWGGRINFLIGLAGAVLFTVLFAVTGLIPIFTLAWFGNRLTQSLSRAGLIKVSSKWFNFSSYGTVLGILSVSFLVGDAAARQMMGSLIHHGYGWRALFYFAAGVSAACLLVNLLLLRESRTDLGFEEAKPNPLNLYSQASAPPASVSELLRPLFRSPAFQLVCLLSFALTIVRETFNNWTPEYLHAHLGFSAGDAGSMSAIFPGVGAVSVLVTGWLSDRLGMNGRTMVMFTGLILATAALVALMSVPASAASTVLPLLAIGGVAFCLLGPYSYLGGAFALDFGGKQGSAVASGIIDGIGYIGGILAGTSVTQISAAYGWQGVFVALAVVTALAALASGVLYALRYRAAAIQQTAQ